MMILYFLELFHTIKTSKKNYGGKNTHSLIINACSYDFSWNIKYDAIKHTVDYIYFHRNYAETIFTYQQDLINKFHNSNKSNRIKMLIEQREIVTSQIQELTGSRNLSTLVIKMYAKLYFFFVLNLWEENLNNIIDVDDNMKVTIERIRERITAKINESDDIRLIILDRNITINLTSFMSGSNILELVYTAINRKFYIFIDIDKIKYNNKKRRSIYMKKISTHKNEQLNRHFNSGKNLAKMVDLVCIKNKLDISKLINFLEEQNTKSSTFILFDFEQFTVYHIFRFLEYINNMHASNDANFISALSRKKEKIFFARFNSIIRMINGLKFNKKKVEVICVCIEDFDYTHYIIRFLATEFSFEQRYIQNIAFFIRNLLTYCLKNQIHTVSR